MLPKVKYDSIQTKATTGTALYQGSWHGGMRINLVCRWGARCSNHSLFGNLSKLWYHSLICPFSHIIVVWFGKQRLQCSSLYQCLILLSEDSPAEEILHLIGKEKTLSYEIGFGKKEFETEAISQQLLLQTTTSNKPDWIRLSRADKNTRFSKFRVRSCRGLTLYVNVTKQQVRMRSFRQKWFATQKLFFQRKITCWQTRRPLKAIRYDDA